MSFLGGLIIGLVVGALAMAVWFLLVHGDCRRP